MRLKNLIQTLRESVPGISKQEAINRKMFGPVYHGSSENGRQNIAQNGFQIIDPESTQRSNGYEVSNYAMNMPAPLHHLGIGVYFTTSKGIAKNYNGGTLKGLKEYYLDVPRLETINFASPNTMMRWWIAHGYDFTWPQEPTVGVSGQFSQIDFRNARPEQIRATRHMTEVLSSQFDAVWFRGKTLYKVLDGDQVCVYDPSRIYMVDPKLSQPMEVGSKVVHNQNLYIDYPHMQLVPVEIGGGARRLVNPKTGGGIRYIPPAGMKGIILSKTPITPEQRRFLPPRAQNSAEYRYEVKWAKGGIQHNYYDGELDPA